MNTIIQLWDQLIECSLLGFHAALLARLNSGNDGCELTDLDNALIKIVLVLLFDLELELSKSIVDLPIEIDHVTYILELLIYVVEMSCLLYELIHVFNLLREVGNALAQPLLLHVSSLTDDLRD